MARLPTFLTLVAICLAGAGKADAAPANNAPLPPPKQVEGLVVVGGPGPNVTASYPAPGAAVPSGELILKIVFDRAMTPGAWSYSPSPDGEFPHCLADPRLLPDQRTYVLLCQVSAGRTYALEINDVRRFSDAVGRSARPYALSFHTLEDSTASLHDALQQAGLTDADSPIMTWRDPGKGVSQSPEAP